MESYALIKEPVATLWDAPRDGAERIDEALCGNMVQVLKEEGVFQRVRTAYRYEGWVYKRTLFPIDSPNVWEEAPKEVVCAPFADVQSEPSVRAFSLCALPRGALVQRTESRVDAWRGIRLPDGTAGFLPASTLAVPVQGSGGRSQARFRRDVVHAAFSYLGAPYRWGGKTPMGVDCSGLCFMAYALNGIFIFRDARIEPGFPIRKIPPRCARPGDLLYFPGHMAMLIGNGRYIHATAGNGCHGVVVNSLNPRSPEYRADLPKKLLAVGSLF